ncbi:hypothetical protein [Sphingobacterium faecale]|uniref:DUF1882 domain-containing protein n=1 Tax=Sphingobacterium faecale TaxID=2803775 RepID=A0ABS1R5X9_9SPHI|nr:hypothetical protein [Sphingobacterium faecale]MBL1410108.1 hypothetical protein [Sphingobacterium faecale]
MTTNDTKQIVALYFEEKNHITHKYDKKLIINNRKYRIRPDDAYYFANKVVIVEYENNLRPVESISKYLWLFRKTNWLNENIKISLLLTINNCKVESDYKIRTESILELGELLKQLYPDHFDFSLLSYSDLDNDNINISLDLLMAKQW